ncbi:MAG: HAMP domain-containing histidine kinase [Myxococcales bacterium]|nr:HAMP domain-containing histidine kinase [Myxococcales bacterium]
MIHSPRASLKVLFAGVSTSVGRAFEAHGGHYDSRCVGDEEGLDASLRGGRFDVIVGDADALELALNLQPETPRVAVIDTESTLSLRWVNRVAATVVVLQRELDGAFDASVLEALSRGRAVHRRLSTEPTGGHEQLRRMGRRTHLAALSTLSREVDHDLRNALQSLDLAAELASMQKAPTVRECLRHSQERLRALGEMLTLCQNTDAITAGATRFAVGSSLREVDRLVRMILAGLDVGLSVVGDELPAEVEAPREAWEATLAGFLGVEAREAGAGAVLDVTAFAEEAAVRVTIESTVACPPLRRARGFPRGRALALDLLAGVCEAVGGSLHVHPLGPDGGTRVTATLPRASERRGTVQWTEAKAPTAPVAFVGRR